MNPSAAREDEIPAIAALLAAAGLPNSDVLPHAHPDFLVLRDAEQIVGVVGLERYGATGLLRSLAVRPESRVRGLGDALVRAVERRGREQGVTQMVLLTQTAQDFFHRRGYAVIARDDAPAAVQASSEFRSLCPSSAACMSKRLDR
jgi:amino-acid N-acetyltransferase